MSFYSEHIYLFHVPQIHHTKWRHLAKVNEDFALTNAKGVKHNMFRRTGLGKLLNKIDCSSVLRDGKIEAVHSLLEQQQALYLLAI